MRIGMKLTLAMGAMALMLSCDQTVEGLDAGTGEDAGVNADAGGGGPSVLVTYGGEQHAVALGSLATVDFAGAPHIKLSIAILAAFNGPSIAELKVDDLIADDGYTPTTRSNCDGMLPVAGEDTEQGFIEPDTRNLVWDAALTFPGCMAVDSLHEIKISDQ
jgi:hypothetical protein